MSEKKKMLIVSDLLFGGGVEKLIYDLVEDWHDKYDITVMTYVYSDGFEDVFPADVKYISSSVKKRYEKRFIGKAYTMVKDKVYNKVFDFFIKKKSYDIAIAMKEGATMDAVTYLKKIPVKYGWIHTDYYDHYYTYHIFGDAERERLCMQQYNGIVCVAETIKQSVIDVIGDPGNLLVKYNPINVDNVVKKGEEPVVDIDTEHKEGVTRFVTAGRLCLQKGYDILLEACHMLELDGYKFEVWVVGGNDHSGGEHERLYGAQKRLKCDSVKFLGLRKNPYKYMKQADWFVSSSVYEGYSLVSQEAAVLDIPLILTECSGVRELLGDDEYGIVTEPSVIGVYNAMKRVMDNPELHDHYKQKIMQRKEIISFKERIDNIEEMLNS